IFCFVVFAPLSVVSSKSIFDESLAYVELSDDLVQALEKITLVWNASKWFFMSSEPINKTGDVYSYNKCGAEIKRCGGFGFNRSCPSGRAAALEEKLLNVCIRHLKPLNFTEGNGFKDLMNFVEPSYKFPSHSKIARLLHQKADLYLDNVRLVVWENPQGSLTTDLWSSACCNAYMGITYHTIKKDWTLYSKVLAVRHFENKCHIAEKIQECLKSIIDEWRIDCVEIVHDNASNMLMITPLLFDDIQTHFGDN
uniref:DUF659 domain-containing protein n=1 Tax=Romanomermis culicivorax TaxID=13658 RepID=A0A915J001_ROMCU